MKPTLKFLLAIGSMTLFFACTQNSDQHKQGSSSGEAMDTLNSKKQIAGMLDSFNLAAAAADYDRYFSFYTEDARFSGTDATEHWDKKAFMNWAKPYFDSKKTWNFRSIDRHIYFGKHSDMAWFDELLNTQMKICRGSGVVVKENNEWKIKQYVLSTTIPNSLLDTIIKMKAPVEDSIIHIYQGK